MPARRPLRQLILLLLWLALSGLSGWGAYLLAQRLGIADLRATGMHRLELYGASLQREIGKYAFLPDVLALEGNVQRLLAEPGDEQLTNRVNAYLEQLNDRAGTLTAYLVDARGHVVASSNWRRSDSYMGEDLSFRPYYRTAMATGSARFFGIGTTRGEPGYYLASTLGDDTHTLGVAVVKVSLDQLEQSWSTVEAPVLVGDENGVVILGTVSDWKFTTLRTLDEGTRAAFDHTRQYNRRALEPLGLQVLRDLGQGARLVRIARHGEESPGSVYPVSGRFLAQSRQLPGTPWTITVLSHLEQVDQLAQSRALAAAVGAAFVLLLAMMVNERRRHLRDRLAAREALQAAHDELERKVEQRTADLSAVRPFCDLVLYSMTFNNELDHDLATLEAYGSFRREAAALGIQGVPFFVVDRRLGVSGAQPAEVFTQLLEQAWRDANPPLAIPTIAGAADAEACGPDGC